MKYLSLFLIILIIGCSTGIKPIPGKVLSGKVNPNAPTNLVQSVTVVIPKKTNTFVVQPTQEIKELVNQNKSLKFNIVSESSTNVIKLQNQPPESITNNFLIWWYGTLILIISLLLIHWMGFLKNLKKKFKK